MVAQLPQPALASARQCLYQLFSHALADPRSQRFARLYSGEFQTLCIAAAELLREEASLCTLELAPGELSPSLLDPSELFSNLLPDGQMPGEHDRTFGLIGGRKCPPFETEYSPQAFPTSRSHQLADVAGFYRAFGLQPHPDHPERHNHASIELEFMAWLIAKHQRAVGEDLPESDERALTCLNAQDAFFQNHLAWWLPQFCFGLRRNADGLESPADLSLRSGSFYGALAFNLAAFVAAERAILAIAPPEVGDAAARRR